MRRKRALITGASSGIGLAFAHHCARRGMDVVLVARRQERLRALAKELAEGHSITATVEVADLADPGAPAQIESSLAEAGLEIDTLINNAGYGLAGSFLLHKWEVHQRFLQVMLHSVCELTHRLLPAMIERGHGRVIIVSSVAGLLPGTAGHTLYAAVKAALNLFVESLALEQGRSDVHVTALCPGFTSTTSTAPASGSQSCHAGCGSMPSASPVRGWRRASEATPTASPESSTGRSLCCLG